MAAYFDLTHVIKENMPVYPGTERPKLSTANTIEKDGFRETLLQMYSHTGTHTDAPAHIFKNGKTLDSFEAHELCGRAIMADFTTKERDGKITASDLMPIKDALLRSDFLIIRTGYEDKWENDEYFYGYPTLTKDACELILECGIKGLGVDAISIDPACERLVNHELLLSKKDGFVIVENLCNLDAIPKCEFDIMIMPLKFLNADGAPSRVVAIV